MNNLGLTVILGHHTLSANVNILNHIGHISENRETYCPMSPFLDVVDFCKESSF